MDDIAEDGATILKVGAIAPYTSKVSKQDLIDQMQAKKDAGAIDTFYTDRINYIADSYQNYPDETTQAIYYFLDRREVEKAATTPYLNFKTEYLRGNNATYSINWKLDLFNRTLNFTTTGYVGSTNLNDNVTIGIHSRGGGRLDYKERNSVFNYVDMVAKKVKEAHGITLDKEAIYSGDYDDYVQEAVEDIIILEDRLTEVRYQIERLQTSLNNWDRQVSYSTVYLDSLYHTGIYKVFAIVNLVKGEWDPSTASFASDADFLAFIRQAQARSLYDTGVEVTAADGRLIVLAVEQ